MRYDFALALFDFAAPRNARGLDVTFGSRPAGQTPKWCRKKTWRSGPLRLRGCQILYARASEPFNLSPQRSCERSFFTFLRSVMDPRKKKQKQIRALQPKVAVRHSSDLRWKVWKWNVTCFPIVTALSLLEVVGRRVSGLSFAGLFGVGPKCWVWRVGCPAKGSTGVRYGLIIVNFFARFMHPSNLCHTRTVDSANSRCSNLMRCLRRVCVQEVTHGGVTRRFCQSRWLPTICRAFHAGSICSNLATHRRHLLRNGIAAIESVYSWSTFELGS